MSLNDPQWGNRGNDNGGGKRPNQGRWLECGVARAEGDGTINLYLDRLPVGGFSGKVHLARLGDIPAIPEPKPQRPGQAEGDADEDIER